MLNQVHDPGYRLEQQVLGNTLSRQITYVRRDDLRTSDVTYDGSGVISDLNLGYTYFVDKT